MYRITLLENENKMTRYKKIIREKGLKMSWISKELSIPRSTLSNYINGKREIPADIEFKLNKIFSI